MAGSGYYSKEDRSYFSKVDGEQAGGQARAIHVKNTRDSRDHWSGCRLVISKIYCRACNHKSCSIEWIVWNKNKPASIGNERSNTVFLYLEGEEESWKKEVTSRNKVKMWRWNERRRDEYSTDACIKSLSCVRDKVCLRGGEPR